MDLIEDRGVANTGQLFDAQGFGRFAFSSVSGMSSDMLGSTSSSGWTVSGNLQIAIANLAASYTSSGTDDGNIVSDVNGDGFPDLVFLNNGQIMARLNNGHGGFGAAVSQGQLSAADIVPSNLDRVAASANQRYRPDNPIPGQLITQQISPEYPITQRVPLVPTATTSFSAGGPTTVGGTLDKNINAAVTVLVQGVNRLLYKTTIPASAAGSIPISATVKWIGVSKRFFERMRTMPDRSSAAQTTSGPSRCVARASPATNDEGECSTYLTFE